MALLFSHWVQINWTLHFSLICTCWHLSEAPVHVQRELHRRLRHRAAQFLEKHASAPTMSVVMNQHLPHSSSGSDTLLGSYYLEVYLCPQHKTRQEVYEIRKWIKFTSTKGMHNNITQYNHNSIIIILINYKLFIIAQKILIISGFRFFLCPWIGFFSFQKKKKSEAYWAYWIKMGYILYPMPQV